MKKPQRKRKPVKRGRGITIEDLERAMGQKADKISPYRLDPESMTFTRTITFKLKL